MEKKNIKEKKKRKINKTNWKRSRKKGREGKQKG